MNLHLSRRAAFGLALFAAVSLALLAFFSARFGGPTIGGTSGLRVRVLVADAQGMPTGADVLVRGVRVGSVKAQHAAGARTELVLALGDTPALHPDATVRIGSKTPLGEPFVDLDPGKAAGARPRVLRSKPAVEIDEALSVLDRTGRADAGALSEKLARGLRSPAAGARLNATLAQASRAVAAFGRLGEQLRAQRGDLAATVLNSRAVLDDLATRDGDIRGLVEDAAATLRAAGASRAALRATVARLPRTLASARATMAAARPLTRRATPLATATARASAPLARALRAAPATLVDAAAVLRAAPAVRAAATPALRSLPRTLAAARPAAELLGPVLANLVPVARFLGPRSATAAAWFSNTADLGSNGDTKGRWARFFVLFDGATALGTPSDPPGNSYTAPGDAAANRAYAAGGYPRLLPYGPALGSGGTGARNDGP